MIDSPYQYDITCQYNSNVLTLVAITYYVAGLFDVSEVCWVGITSLQPTCLPVAYEDEGLCAL